MATRDAKNGPVLGTPDDFPDRPERQGRLVMHVVIGLLVAIFMGGWGYVVWIATGDSGVPSRVLAFSIDAPDHAEITYAVTAPSDRDVACRIQALDKNHVEVGSKEVTIAAGEGMNQLKESLQTSAQASSVHIQYCNLV